jgi:hypothetical protein
LFRNHIIETIKRLNKLNLSLASVDNSSFELFIKDLKFNYKNCTSKSYKSNENNYFSKLIEKSDFKNKTVLNKACQILLKKIRKFYLSSLNNEIYLKPIKIKKKLKNQIKKKKKKNILKNENNKKKKKMVNEIKTNENIEINEIKINENIESVENFILNFNNEELNLNDLNKNKENVELNFNDNTVLNEIINEDKDEKKKNIKIGK